MGKLSASMAFALLFAGAHATSPRVTILYEDNHSTTMSTTARIDDNGLPAPHNGKVATVLIGVRYKYGVYLPPDTIFMDCRTRGAFWNARRDFRIPPKMADVANSHLILAWDASCGEVPRR